MNPLTQVKNTQKATQRELDAGIQEGASWHACYRDSAYIFAGGLPFDLTEGDLLAVFAQYGEIVDVNLVRDRDTGKSRGFAFLAYADQRSTILAIDNFNGAVIGGRTVKVDHVADYKKKKEEDEEEARRAREERGICHAFQRGECKRGGGCKYSHNLERAADTGWNEEDERNARARELGGGHVRGSTGRWPNDLYEGRRYSKEVDIKGGRQNAEAAGQRGGQRPSQAMPAVVPGSNPWEGTVYQLLQASTADKHAKSLNRMEGERAQTKEVAERHKKEEDDKGSQKRDRKKSSNTRHDWKRNKNSPRRGWDEEDPLDMGRHAKKETSVGGFPREDLSGEEDEREHNGDVERERNELKSRRDRGRAQGNGYGVEKKLGCEGALLDIERHTDVKRAGRGLSREDLTGEEDERERSRGVERDRSELKSGRDRGVAGGDEYRVERTQGRNKSIATDHDRNSSKRETPQWNGEKAARRGEKRQDEKAGIERSKYREREHGDEKDRCAERSRGQGTTSGDRDRGTDMDGDKEQHRHRDPQRRYKNTDAHRERDRSRHGWS